MAYNTISELFKGICDALRNKTGATGLINHQDIPARINGIVASGTGVDTSNTTATEDVILQDYTAYSKNELITGNLPYVENGGSRRYYNNGVTLTTSSTDAAYARVTNDYTINSPRAFLYGSKLHLDVPFSDFGNAEKKHVLAGQTFTSFEGLLQVGEYVPTSADGSGVDTTISTNGATASDILKNKKAWVNNTLIIGTHECTEGIDTSNATVTPEDMAEGIIAYGADGKEVIGNVKTYDTQVGWNNRTPKETSDALSLSISTSTPYLFRNGFFLTTPLTNLGDAKQENVLDSVTFTSSAGLMKTGTIATINGASPSISIDSSGVVTASVEHRKGYIETEEILSATKQLTTKAATTYTPGTTDQTIANGTYLTGVQTISGDSNLTPDNIKKGVSIFGISGSYEGEQSSSVAVYKWRKYTVVSHGYTESVTDGQGGTYYASGLSSLSRVIYADKTFDSNTGKITLSNPLSTEKSAWADQYSNYISYPYYYGDYLDGSVDNTVYKIKSMSEGGNSMVKNYTYSSDKYVASADSMEQGNYIEDIYHISSSAFPTNGVQNGYWYVSQGQVTE